MRVLPVGLEESLYGSNGGARIQFNSWYNGAVVASDLPVSNYRFDWDGSRQIIGNMSCTVVDNTGTLSPWAISDALGVGGAIIQSQFILGNYSVPLGWQRITKADPDETWTVSGAKFRWVQNSAEIGVEAKDLTVAVQGARFMGAEAPKAGATCISEIRRLLSGLMDVVLDPAVKDKAVPSGIVYKEDRLAAVLDLVDALGAGGRCIASGQFYLYIPSTAPVWNAQGGIEGTFVKLRRSMQIDDFPNAVISTNTAADGTPLFGVATQATGDGFFDGPHGRWPLVHNANFATTQAEIAQDASTYLANLRRKRTVEVPVRIMFHPGIEPGDYIGLDVPVLNGTTRNISGEVKKISYSGNTAAPAFMDITLSAPAAAVQKISTAMRQAQLWGNI